MNEQVVPLRRRRDLSVGTGYRDRSAARDEDDPLQPAPT
jgi:hypothetical protein